MPRPKTRTAADKARQNRENQQRFYEKRSGEKFQSFRKFVYPFDGTGEHGWTGDDLGPKYDKAKELAAELCAELEEATGTLDANHGNRRNALAVMKLLEKTGLVPNAISHTQGA